METIKNYLETMFANMPNTPEVRKAKAELLSMMEDKYTELREDGKNENEAVATVIAEFGNLDELAETLGLEQEVREGRAYESENPRRLVSLDTVKEYLFDRARRGLAIGIGVLLCITCTIGPVITSETEAYERIGVFAMFVMLAVAICIFVYTSVTSEKWKYLKKEACQIDINTANYVMDERNKYANTNALRLTIGIILCVMCWLPAALLDGMWVGEIAGAVALFVMVGVGVCMIIYTSAVRKSYDVILNLNDKRTVSGGYHTENSPKYINDTVATVMEVFWPTVTCLYFIWSFLTFDWYITWIIWPVAAVIQKIININLVQK